MAPGSPVSRRTLLKTGAAAALGSGSVLGVTLAGQQPASPQRQSAGTKFRAFVKHGATSSVEELTLRPIGPRQVLVRSLATGCCYYAAASLGEGGPLYQPAAEARVWGHGGTGIVEEVGSQVKRVEVGDRVIVCDTPQCGECFQCLRGRAYRCQAFFNNTPVHYAEMSDGTPVRGGGGAPSSCAELIAPYEEFVVPIESAVPDAELALLCDSAATGLAATMTMCPVEPGSNVVVFGAGPVGLSAIQGARIMAAAQIICIEPIAYRREVALKVGATSALDPNAEGEQLVTTVQEMCRGPYRTDRRFSGARPGAPGMRSGPDYVIEASGADWFPPQVEVGPDPTGRLALKQALAMGAHGSDVFLVANWPSEDITFGAREFPGGFGRTIYNGQLGGISMKRDLPRFVRLIETGLLDMKSLATGIYPLDLARDAFQATADRTTVGAVVVFS